MTIAILNLNQRTAVFAAKDMPLAATRRFVLVTMGSSPRALLSQAAFLRCGCRYSVQPPAAT
jgi:hypothetical protein